MHFGTGIERYIHATQLRIRVQLVIKKSADVFEQFGLVELISKFFNCLAIALGYNNNNNIQYQEWT
jgi:hypothetical protein